MLMSATIYQPSVASSVSAEPIWGTALECPQCGGFFEPIAQIGAKGRCQLRCSSCFFVLQTENGIWKALPVDREAYFRRFMTEYQIVRAAEGRGGPSSEYYLALPYHDFSGRRESQWAIRSRSFCYIENKIMPLLESRCRFPMKILDLGAGNGWMSYRLALRGHQPVAVDLLTNDQDGLGAAVHYREHLPLLFPRFQAELDRLPFGDSQFDCAIFNASFHYSEDYSRSLGEAIRCLRPAGTVVIADSPFYGSEESGQRMLQERRAEFMRRFGFPSDSLKSLEYLTAERLT